MALSVPLSRSSIASFLSSSIKSGFYRRFQLTWVNGQSQSCHIRCSAVAKAEKVQLPKKKNVGLSGCMTPQANYLLSADKIARAYQLKHMVDAKELAGAKKTAY